MARTRIRIVYLFRTGRHRLLDSLNSGDRPSDFLYGFATLKQLEADAILEEFAPSGAPALSQWILNRLGRCIEPFLLCRIWLERAWWAMKRMRPGDVVVTNIDSIGLSLAVICSVLPRPPRLLHLSQGLTNRMDARSGISFFADLQRTATAHLCSRFDRVVVLGEGAKTSYLKHHLISASKLSCVQFGVDVDFWHPGGEESAAEQREQPYVLSVGSDDGRDYETLLECSFPCKLIVVTRKQLPPHEQVEQRSEISDVELRELYQHAAFVVIPLRDLPQPSGQSATLQAMACGKAVIVTRTCGFWDPQRLGENEHLRTVVPGDANALEQAVWTLFNDPERAREIGVNARKCVEQHYSEAQFGRTMWRLSRQEWSKVAKVVV